jgi:Mlc titration factor MtfA (ptsG expression regulator)
VSDLLVPVALLVCGAMVPVFFVVKIWRKKRRRLALRDAPFSEEWGEIIRKNLPLYERLPENLRTELTEHVAVFLAEKHFEGCAGLEITDEIRVTVAAQACMLLLNRPPTYYPRLSTVLIYPSAYTVSQNVSPDGTVGGPEQVRLGESWSTGVVVLAWDSVLQGAWDIRDGKNVVLHEFAHQLDQEDGAADGAPILEHHTHYVAWARVLSAEYEQLCKKKKKRRKTVMNKYGATNPAEFFAVASESFFEKSAQLKKRHPELYEELESYYSVNPVEWR